MSKPHTIDIIVDGKLFCTRTWRNVPRVGDLILVGGGTKTVKVVNVVWSDAGSDSCIYDAWIQLVCKKVAHAVKGTKK